MTKLPFALPGTRAENTEAPKRPIIRPSMVSFDFVGQETRQLIIRLPAGIGKSDLGDPTLWAAIQRDHEAGKSLVKFDRLEIRLHDESQMILAVVNGAGADAASLTITKVVDLEAQLETLYEDETKRIAWTGKGWQTLRKSDGVPLTGIAPTKDSARREFDNVAARPAA